MRTWENGSPCALLAGTQNGAAAMENGVAAAQKVKASFIVWSSNSSSDTVLKKLKAGSWWDLRTHVHSSIFTVAKGGSNPSARRQMNGRAGCKRLERCHATRTGKEIDTGAWMKPEDMMLREISRERTNAAWFRLHELLSIKSGEENCGCQCLGRCPMGVVLEKVLKMGSASRSV